MKEKSILLVSNFFPPEIEGGAEVVAARQASLLAEQGWDVAVLCGTKRGPGTSVNLTVDDHDGIPVYRAVMKTLDPSGNFRDPSIARLLRSLIAIREPSWVHFHNVIGLGANLIKLVKEAGPRSCVTLHDRWGICFKNTMLRNDGALCRDAEECHVCLPNVATERGLKLPIRLRRDYVASCLGQADQLVAPSASIANAYQEWGFPDQSIDVVSNGIDLENIRPRVRSPSGPVRFLCAAYLGEHKGIPILLSALERLWRDVELRGRWEVVIAGHGHLESKVRNAIAAAGMGDAVEFVGRLERMKLLGVLEGVHAVILPSIWPENEPVILLEAISSGAVPIASNIGGNAELIDHGRSGLLFEPASEGALIGAMLELINHPDRIEVFSNVNLGRRAGFAERQAISKLIQLYEGDRTSASSSEIVVICGGTAPDHETVATIEMSGKVVPGHSLRLIWQEWANSSDWERASAYWLWDREISLANASDAARRGIPLFARAGSAFDKIRPIIPNASEYETGEDLLVLLQSLGGKQARCESLPMTNDIFRIHDHIRPRAEYFLPTLG